MTGQGLPDPVRTWLEANLEQPRPGDCPDCGSVHVLHRDGPNGYLLQRLHDSGCPAHRGITCSGDDVEKAPQPAGSDSPDTLRALELLARYATGDYTGVREVLWDVVADTRVLQTFDAIFEVVLEVLRPDLNNRPGARRLAELARQITPDEDDGDAL